MSLLELPEVVMDLILKHSEYRAIQILRKVCRDLRNYIDDAKPDTSFLEMGIRIEPLTLRIDYRYSMTEFEKRISYCKQKEKRIDSETGTVSYVEFCEIYNDNRLAKWMENENYLEMFNKDLHQFLIFQKTPLRRFVIQSDSIELSKQVYPIIKSILESRSTPLSTEDLYMLASNQSDVLCVLPFLDPEKIEEFLIGDIYESLPLEIDELIKLKHWKTVKNMTIRKMVPPKSMKHFTHLLEGFVEIEVISTEELVLLKQAYRHSEFKSMCICYEKIENQQEFWDVMGPRFVVPKWYFSIPNCHKILLIEHNTEEKTIQYESIDKSRVEQNGIIQD